MLVWQAVVSHEIWNGTSFNSDDIEKLCADSAEYLKKHFKHFACRKLYEG